MVEEVSRIALIPPFLQWLKENGASWNSVEPKEYGKTHGIGMIATNDILVRLLITAIPLFKIMSILYDCY